MPKSPYMTDDFKKEVARYALFDTKATFELWKQHAYRMPEHEWQISNMTRQMGMRGVPVNLEKLRAAEQKLIEEKHRAESLLPWIGGEYPPLSLQAIREQCDKEGIRKPKSFAEKDPEGAAWEAEFADKFPWVRAVRDYRKANKHLKTVQTMIARTRPDGRMGYELKYFGATTGRDSGGGGWNCMTGDHEVLTPEGWVSIEAWNPTSPIMQFLPDGTLEFVEGSKIEKPHTGTLISVDGPRVRGCFTPDHRIISHRRAKLTATEARELLHQDIRNIPTAGNFIHAQSQLTDDELRVLVALAADGHETKKDSISFGFKKQRKIDRLEALLNNTNIPFTKTIRPDGVTNFSIQKYDRPYWLKKGIAEWVLDLSPEQAQIVIEELALWDGYFHYKNGAVNFSTTREKEALWVATLGHLHGVACSVNRYTRKDGTCPRFVTYFTQGHTTDLRPGTGTITASEIPFEGTVYCASVPSGAILIRYKDRIHVTGNCQNIPKGEVAGVDIRNLIEAPEGKTLIICDLAQIEARCLPYLAGDKELLKLIASGIDIYEAHARATMGYTDPRPLKDVDPKMRFLAKARVLGLGFSCGAAKFQLVAKMLAGLDISFEESQQIVQSYRESSPKIIALWAKLDRALKISTDPNDRELIVPLPSGRELIYRGVRRLGRGDIVAKLPRLGKLMDVKLYGGLLAENCLAGGTQVLTQERGWVSLEDITTSDLVWDGEEFVAHQGLIHKGSKPVIEMDGIVCTPDHLFMTDKSGWASASAICAGYYTALSLQNEYSKQAESLETLRSTGKENRTFNSSAESGQQRRPHRMGSEVRLREHDCENSEEPQSARHLLETMSDPSGQYLKETSDTWDDEASRLQYLEKYDRPLPTSISPILAQLRGAWDQGLSRVAKGLSKLLGRHGADLQKGFVLGSNQQQRRIPQGELPMGNPSSSSQEHKTFRDSSLGAGCSQQERSKEEHLVLQDSAWSSSGDCLHSKTRRVAEVYDILNCGPRSRFAVRTPLGKIYLAHNCTQAFARDVFMDRCVALESAGYEILMRVHDEVVLLVDEADAEAKRLEVEQIMSTPPDWCKDLPLGAESIISKFYRK